MRENMLDNVEKRKRQKPNKLFLSFYASILPQNQQFFKSCNDISKGLLYDLEVVLWSIISR